jgi:hypothetical protein
MSQAEHFSKLSLVFISQVVSMIRYSSYAVANYRTPASAEIIYLDPLQVQYQELQKLRQRVREAEAAAAQGRSGVRKENYGK